MCLFGNTCNRTFFSKVESHGKVKIISWFNGVCSSRGFFFRWHFLHVYCQNKVFFWWTWLKILFTTIFVYILNHFEWRWIGLDLEKYLFKMAFRRNPFNSCPLVKVSFHRDYLWNHIICENFKSLQQICLEIFYSLNYCKFRTLATGKYLNVFMLLRNLNC